MLFANKWRSDVNSDLKVVRNNLSSSGFMRLIPPRNFTPVVSHLSIEGAEVETQDSYWLQAPLAWAAKRGNHAPAKLLLEKGADANSKNKDGQTSLTLAAIRGYKDLVILLIQYGAHIGQKDSAGLTAASYAAKSGNKESINILDIIATI
jgi:hypothetical protein